MTDLNVLINQYHSKKYDVYIMRGKSLSQLNQAANAIKDYTKAITLKNTEAEAYYLRGLEYSKLGKTKEPLAIKDFNKAIELSPNNSEAYLKRGIYFMNKQKYTEAMEDLNKSIKLNPGAEAYFYRGSVLYEQKKYTEACLDLKKAAQMGYEEAKRRQAEVCPNN